MAELIKVSETIIEKQKETINAFEVFYTYSLPIEGNPIAIEFSMNDSRGGILYGTYSEANVSFNMSGVPEAITMIAAILNTCEQLVNPEL